MPERTCSINGCEAPHKARGFCAMHYRRWQCSGNPGPPGRKNFPAPAECIVDGCSAVPLAKGLCSAHRSRLLRHGDVEANPRMPRGTCEIPGCGQPHYSRGYCSRHYGRLWRHGDPEALARPVPPGQLGYVGAHARIYTARGPASGQACRHCGGPAAHWAYDHGDPHAQVDPRGFPYSLDPGHYLPLCARCHLAFDRKANEPYETQGRPDWAPT